MLHRLQTNTAARGPLLLGAPPESPFGILDVGVWAPVTPLLSIREGWLALPVTAEALAPVNAENKATAGPGEAAD